MHQAFFDEDQQVTLAHQRVAQVQFVELCLARTVVVEILTLFQPVDEQVVQGTVHDKLKRTQRMSDTFEEVALPVCKVVHRVCFPLVTGTVVRSLDDAVDDRVAEVHVRVCHVDLGTQNHRTFFQFAAVHLVEQLQVFFDRAVTIGAVCARLCRRPFLGSDLFGRLLVDVCFSFLDQLDGEVPELLEVVGCVVNIIPVVTQPFDVFFDGVHIFQVFFYRVGIVEAQVANAPIFLGNAEIQADSFGMPDMQVSVGFGWKTGLHTPLVFTFRQIFFHHCFDEIQAFFAFFRFVCFDIAHFCSWMFSVQSLQR